LEKARDLLPESADGALPPRLPERVDLELETEEVGPEPVPRVGLRVAVRQVEPDDGAGRIEHGAVQMLREEARERVDAGLLGLVTRRFPRAVAPRNRLRDRPRQDAEQLGRAPVDPEGRRQIPP